MQICETRMVKCKAYNITRTKREEKTDMDLFAYGLEVRTDWEYSSNSTDHLIDNVMTFDACFRLY